MSDLERRLADLEARAAIVEVMHRYGASVDYGDEAGWVDCFTDDGVFEIDHRQADFRVVVASGRAELAVFIAGHSRAPEQYHKHNTVNSLIELDGDRASCRSYFFVTIAGPDGIPAIAGMGRYVDELQRGADGRWRIAHRVAQIEGVDPQWNLQRANPGDDV